METLLSVDKIGRDDYYILDSTRNKTLEQRATMDRFEYEEFWQLCLDDAPECVEWSIMDKLDSVVRAREWYLLNDSNMSAGDAGDLKMRHMMDHKNQVIRRELLDIGMMKLGIVDDECQSEFSKDSKRVRAFTDWCDSGDVSRRVKEVIGLTVGGQRAEDSPVRVVGDFIKKTGLILGKSKRKHVDDERIRYQTIDQDVARIVNSAMQRRLS